MGFRNVRPLAGEEATYSAVQPTDKPHQTYATLALLPNLSNSGLVLLLNGASMESTEAAGDLAMSAGFPATMQEGARASRRANRSPFSNCSCGFTSPRRAR